MFKFTGLLLMCSAVYRISGEVCVLRETSRNPWLVKIWKPTQGMIVGHGALLSSDKVLSSCNPFAHLSPDLANERFEMIVHDYGGVDRTTPYCKDSRFANAIMIHPECDPSSSSQLHDFAMWNLTSPFEVVGHPFVTSLLPEYKSLILKISEIGLKNQCRLVTTDDPKFRGSFGLEKTVGRCGFKDYETVDVCDGENCPPQRADGLLCFYSRKKSRSWKVRQTSETPDFVEGSVVLCFGTPVGIASRAFNSNDYEVYRMFSNFANNLDFLKTSWNPTTTTTTTMPSPTTNATTTTTTDGGRTTDTSTTTRLTTPINCLCQMVGPHLPQKGVTITSI